MSNQAAALNHWIQGVSKRIIRFQKAICVPVAYVHMIVKFVPYSCELVWSHCSYCCYATYQQTCETLSNSACFDASTAVYGCGFKALWNQMILFDMPCIFALSVKAHITVISFYTRKSTDLLCLCIFFLPADHLGCLRQQEEVMWGKGKDRGENSACVLLVCYFCLVQPNWW